MPWRRRSFVLVWSASAALLGGCAYVRPPKRPSLGIPVKMLQIGAVELGDELVIDFVAPAVTTDGAPLKRLQQIDLRAGAAGPKWQAAARQIEVASTAPGPVHIHVPATPWIGQSIEIRVRAQGKHGRYGDWSEPVRLKVVPPLARPVLKAENAPGGVRLSWPSSEGAEYRIYRLAPLEAQPTVIATVKTPEYIDKQTQYGKNYQYQVLAFVASGNSEAESLGSEPATITPEDIFPPAVPSGLAAIAGVSSIELSWNPNTEPVLRGYYVYRSLEGAPFQRLPDSVATPAYSDHAVESGKRYRYQVSAVDQAGHESARSQIVEMAAQ